MIKQLLISFLYITYANSQLIYINVCSDSNCNANCISWIATNNKCEPCKNIEVCSKNNPSSITTYNSFAIYSDSTCTTQVPNTYTMPIILNNNCEQLYLNGNQYPNGSYRAYNFSVLIGVIVSVVLLLFIKICCLIQRYSKCCKKQQPSFESQTAIVIENQNKMYPIHLPEYGYQVNLVPSAPPAPPTYYPPPMPSAPPALYQNKII